MNLLLGALLDFLQVLGLSNNSKSELVLLLCFIYGKFVIRTSHLCGIKPVIIPQMMPTQTPIATSIGPRMAFVFQLPE